MPVKAKPLTRFQLSSLPKESRLSFMEKMKLSSTLRNWNKEGTDFTEEEYYQLFVYDSNFIDDPSNTE